MAFHKQGPAARIFHKLSAIQEYQYCDIANFILAMPLEMNKMNEVCNF